MFLDSQVAAKTKTKWPLVPSCPRPSLILELLIYDDYKPLKLSWRRHTVAALVVANPNRNALLSLKRKGRGHVCVERERVPSIYLWRTALPPRPIFWQVNRIKTLYSPSSYQESIYYRMYTGVKVPFVPPLSTFPNCFRPTDRPLLTSPLQSFSNQLT